MTSQSDINEQNPAVPAATPERTGVSRLVFQLIEDLAGHAEPQPGHDEKVTLIEEMDMLDAKLRAQSEAFAQQLAEAHSAALAQARIEYEEQLELRVAEERAALTTVCERFTHERRRYFAAVEEQVVRLSLAIAARVLHREAKMDPLLLMGAARVALEKIHDDSETILRVSSDDLSMWMNQFADGTTVRSFRIVPDDRIERGDCVLETSVGTVELGIEVQLAEIERGFFDLLQKRPA